MSRIVPVLMYHHVTPSGGAINVTPENLAGQLQWLRRHGYRSLSSAEFAAHLAGQAAPPRSVLITFDDGYLDNYVYAWPLLQHYGFNALLFIVTSWIGDGPCRPHADGDILARAATDPARLVQAGEDLPHTPDHAQCKQLLAAGDTDSHMLRWSEIERMQQHDIFEFHSHTHTHTRWDLQTADKNTHMQAELAQSRRCLADRLGSVSAHLCWPQGYFDADYVQIARDCGFNYLYTTRAFGRNRPGSDPLSIFRFAVRNTTGASVGRRIRVAAHPLIAPVFNGWKRWKRGHHYPG